VTAAVHGGAGVRDVPQTPNATVTFDNLHF
jgi:hypothetical protein